MKESWMILEAAHMAMIVQALTVSALIGAEPGDLDWSFSTPKVVVRTERIVEEVPGETVVHTVEVPAIPTVQWNPEFLETHKGDDPAMKSSVESLRWIMETNEACAYCQANWRAVSNDRNLISQGWRFGPGGQIQREEVQYDHPLPVWKLMSGKTEVLRWAGTQDANTLAKRYVAEFESVKLANKLLPTKSINAGKLSKEQLDTALSFVKLFFGSSGKQTLPNLRGVVPANGVNVEVPAQITVDWNINDSGGASIKVSPPAIGRWNFLSLSVSGAVYDGKTVTGQTPFSLTNPVFTVE